MTNDDQSRDLFKLLEALERRVALLEQSHALEQRVAVMDAKIDRIIAATYTRPHSVLQRLRLRLLQPPLWKSDQYAPRQLSVDLTHARLPLPDQCPRIVMVTPSYNHARYLPSTIDSVLAQDYPNLVYIVQDGGSADGTLDVLDQYGDRILWRSAPDSGQAQAINRGFDGVDFDLMAYLNSDDILLPGALRYVAKFFLANPDVDVVYSHRIYVDRFGLEIGRGILPPHDAQALKWADYIPQETMFWRRRVWDAVGPIDESFAFALDWDFVLRAQAAGFKFVRLPHFLSCFRVHDAQKTVAWREVGEQEMGRLRKEHLGFTPSWLQIRHGIFPYLRRQLAFHYLYKCKLLRH